MKTQIKTITILAAVASTALLAGAQAQQRNARPNRKPAGINCRVCGNTDKEDMQRNRRPRMQARRHRQFAGKNAPDGRHYARAGNRPAVQPRRPVHQQRPMRFDIDRDGRLSKAERAARRAYVRAIQENKGDTPAKRPAPKPPRQDG